MTTKGGGAAPPAPARIHLGTYPTPITRVEVTTASEDAVLWIKRDDQTSAIYGGNKVRKLELLLAAAREAGKTRLVTLGAAGSHQVVATTLFGKQEGFTVDAVLVAQPSSDHARQNLRAALALGMHPTVASSWPAAPALVAMRLGRDAYFIPLGGSNALGSLGFVDAAKELAAQIEAGLMPEPDVVVVAMGSGGTAAGLAVGFEALDMKTRVIGVAVSPPVPVLAVMARRVAKKTAELVGLSRAKTVRAVQRIEVDKRWVGRGYGYSTREGEAAIVEAAKAGLVLDATYTAKAFACAHARLCAYQDRSVLYWHTLSSAPIDAILASAEQLPPDVACLFR